MVLYAKKSSSRFFRNNDGTMEKSEYDIGSNGEEHRASMQIGLSSQSFRDNILRNDLHYAVEKNQMRVFYQPIVNLQSGDILAVEALVRWKHPDWGLILPEEFIQLAEETRLMGDIDKWVLQEVCKNYRRWLDKGLPAIKVAVNFSGIQFLEEDFANNIKDIINGHKLDPKFLIVEVTENIFLESTDKLSSNIEALKALGIKIALNNFGAGFSSFQYISYFKPDIIKLNGSFIKDVPSNNINSAIVESVIHLTKKLKVKMVVEGIEKWDQLYYLKYMNCYAGQGYIYSNVLDLEDMERVLARKKCKPLIVNFREEVLKENRRNFFRIKLPFSLEATMEIWEVKGNKVNAGSTKVLIKDIGPGGLCFASDIKLPVKNYIILQFTFNLLEKEIKVKGYITRTREIRSNYIEYGVEFVMDENERVELIKILNQVQIKMKKNAL